MKHTCILALCLVSTLSLTGCIGPLSCTDAFFPSNLSVDLSEPLTTHGTYTITTTRDGARDVCELILVDSDDASDCIDGVCVTTLRALGSEECSWQPALFSAGFDDDALASLVLSESQPMPTQLEVEIAYDGAIIASDAYTPTYDVDEPNGWGCGERSTGAVSLTTSNP